MALLRSLFWFAIFVASTFAFTVVFEHGVADFSGNAEKEYTLWRSTIEKWINGESTVKRKTDAP